MKTQFLKRAMFAFALSGVCLLSACKKDYTGKEEQSPLFQKAEKNKLARKYADAVKDYEEFLTTCPKSGKTHLRLADLYKDSLGDPVKAIYHYDRYQSLSTLSQDDKRNVSSMVRACNERYYERLKKDFGPSPADEAEMEDLKNKLSSKENMLNEMRERIKKEIEAKKQLQQQNDTYRKQLGARSTPVKNSASASQPAQGASSDSAVAQSGEKTQSAAAGESGKYKVVAGDTLTKISKKVYGSGKYVSKIREANRDKIGQKDRINIGAELVMPPK